MMGTQHISLKSWPWISRVRTIFGWMTIAALLSVVVANYQLKGKFPGGPWPSHIPRSVRSRYLFLTLVQRSVSTERIIMCSRCVHSFLWIKLKIEGGTIPHLFARMMPPSPHSPQSMRLCGSVRSTARLSSHARSSRFDLQRQ